MTPKQPDWAVRAAEEIYGKVYDIRKSANPDAGGIAAIIRANSGDLIERSHFDDACANLRQCQQDVGKLRSALEENKRCWNERECLCDPKRYGSQCHKHHCLALIESALASVPQPRGDAVNERKANTDWMRNIQLPAKWVSQLGNRNNRISFATDPESMKIWVMQIQDDVLKCIRAAESIPAETGADELATALDGCLSCLPYIHESNDAIEAAKTTARKVLARYKAMKGKQ